MTLGSPPRGHGSVSLGRACDPCPKCGQTCTAHCAQSRTAHCDAYCSHGLPGMQIHEWESKGRLMTEKLNHVRMTAIAPEFVPAESGAVSCGEATSAGSRQGVSSLESEGRPEEILCALCQQQGIATHCSTCDRRCCWRCLCTCGRCGSVDCEQHAADHDDRCPAIRRMPLPPLQKGWADANFNEDTDAIKEAMVPPWPLPPIESTCEDVLLTPAEARGLATLASPVSDAGRTVVVSPALVACDEPMEQDADWMLEDVGPIPSGDSDAPEASKRRRAWSRAHDFPDSDPDSPSDSVREHAEAEAPPACDAEGVSEDDASRGGLLAVAGGGPSSEAELADSGGAGVLRTAAGFGSLLEPPVLGIDRPCRDGR